MKTIHRSLLLALGTVLVSAASLLGAETPKVGDAAPKFQGTDSDGKMVKLEDFHGKKSVLLYFYPKDNTPGCTKEACGLRDRMPDLKKDNVEVIGVSVDSMESHKKFIADQSLNFTLLSDTDIKITDLYNARATGRNISRRISFLISKDGKIVHVTDNPSADIHLAEMKEAVAKLK